MTNRQKRFCDEYLIDCNATQAAIRAGYSKKTARQIGQENLSKPDIKNYIDEHLEKMSSSKIADADEIMRYLTSVLRGETRAEIVVVESVGDFMTEARTMKKAPDEKERLKAAELLGKRYSLFKDRLDIDSDKAIEINISGAGDFDEC